MSLSAPKRVCQVIQLKTEYLEEYKRVGHNARLLSSPSHSSHVQIHTSVWPTILAALSRAHIIDYSIHLLPTPPYPASSDIAGLLIATFKYTGSNFDADMAGVAADEETKRWWKLTDGMQASLATNPTGSEGGRWWVNAEEVFRFEG